MRYFFYDTETGGPTADTSLLTLYGVVTDKNFNELDSIDLKMEPDDGVYLVKAAALDWNKIDLVEHAKVAVPYSTARAQLSQFLRNNNHNMGMEGEILLHSAGWNNSWDNDVLKKQLLPDFEIFFSRHRLDVAGLAVLLKSMGRLPADFHISLVNLGEHYKLDFLDRAHDAKSDIWMTLSVLKCMLKDLNLQNL